MMAQETCYMLSVLNIKVLNILNIKLLNIKESVSSVFKVGIDSRNAEKGGGGG
jgi:hypothetical protein